MKISLNKWLKSSIFGEYLPMLLIVLVLIIGASFFKGQKDTPEEWRQPLTLSSAEFINMNKPLPPIQTRNEIFGLSAGYTEEDRLKDICADFKACSKPDPWTKVYERQIQEYGELATRFLFGYEIYWTETLDYDEDDKEELAIALCGVWGNHCPHKIIIVKDGRIIASTE